MALNAFVLDTFAWIEYFKGTPRGTRVSELFGSSQNRFFSSVITLMELADFAERTRTDFDEVLNIVKSNSSVIEPSESDFIWSGKHHFEMKKKFSNWGYNDSLILSAFYAVTGLNKKAKLVTGDRHFFQFKFTYKI